MKRINLISSPRNLSTALMYSFAQRPDTQVVDEPFYAHYLACAKVSHPGREEVLQSQNQNAEEVIKNIIFGKYSKKVLFVKNMTSHILKMQEDFLEQLVNIIYIRNPKQILASYAQVVKQPTASEIGTIRQFELFQQLKNKGNEPIIFDSNELLKDPKRALENLCAACDIPFTPKMLSWQAGPIPEDGVWAKYWYANVHKTTGFQKQKTSERELPKHLQPLCQQLIPYYEKMHQFRITI